MDYRDDRKRSRSPIGRDGRDSPLRNRSPIRDRSDRSPYKSRSRSPRRRSPDRRDFRDSKDRDRDRDRDSRRSRRSRSRSRSRERRGGYRPSSSSSSSSSSSQPINIPTNVPKSRVLGIFGMSRFTKEDQIASLFRKYGKIDRIQLIYDKSTNTSRGFGFVYMNTEEDAAAAREDLAGIKLDGRELRVDFSTTQRPHTPTPGIYMGNPENNTTSTGRRSPRRSSPGRGRSPRGRSPPLRRSSPRRHSPRRSSPGRRSPRRSSPGRRLSRSPLRRD